MAITLENPNHLLIGLGGTGGKVLKAFKKRLYKEFPDDAKRKKMHPAITFLYVDSTREMMNDNHKDPSWRVLGRDVTFTESEFVNIRPQSAGISQILDNIDSYPGLKHVVKNGNAMRNTLGEIREAAGQKRRAGRIMFASCVNTFLSAVSSKYDEMRREMTHVDSLHIHIFAGLAGGTGSGSIVDVVAQTRKNYPDATIDVYAMVPELNIPAGFNAGRYQENGYAALRELSAMNVCQFLPSDVVTGEEHIRFANTDSLKQFSLMLYSNVNDNGVVVDSVTELPQLVADSVYYRLFLPNTPETQDFFRAWSCENLDQHQVEFNTRSKEGDLERARTKAVSTFGLKRIVFPESRIVEHISYTLSERLIWQMQYNNFKEEGEGYVNEPLKKDYSEYLRDDANLRNWKLDESHLTLNEKILESDKKFDNFESFWKNIVNFYSYDDAKRNGGKEPLRYLESFCEDQFKAHFRLKIGVEQYYADKSADKVLREQSMTIVESIEKQLYSKWYNGVYSMADLLGICDEILEYIKKKINGMEGEISKIDEDIAMISNDCKVVNDDYNHAGLLKRAVGGSSRLYSDLQTLLLELYTNKTLRVAEVFEGKLLGRLRSDFEAFQLELNEFIGKLLKAQEILIKSVADRTRKDTSLDLRKTIIEVSEDDKMTSFENKIERERSKMDALASLMRKQLVHEKEFAHFGEVADMIDDNTITDIADQYLAPQIRAYHDSDDDYRRDKIIGINVLQQLQKMFEKSPEMNMEVFARNIIQQCGVFLKLNPNELNKTMKNNPNPLTHPFSINRQCVIVTMPNAEGDDRLKSFATQLESALKGAFGNDCAENPIMFDHSSAKQNEITLVQVKSCFPVRALDWLTNFKQKYDAQINNANEAIRKENRIVLHIEGDGQDLPLLEGEGDGPKGKALISYFFLAVAFGILKWDKNDMEEEGWCLVTEDDWGTPTKTLISKKFTTIATSEELSPAMRDNIIDAVDDAVRNPELKMSERTALIDQIKVLMRDYVAKESSGPTSPLYRDYGDAAKAALEMIKK